VRDPANITPSAPQPADSGQSPEPKASGEGVALGRISGLRQRYDRTPGPTSELQHSKLISNRKV